MLQEFRENLKGVTATILVGIIIIPFAFFGIDSLFLSGPDNDQAASVNGEKITAFQVQQGIELRRQQILEQFEGIDPSLLTDDQLHGPVVDALVRDAVLYQAARVEGMALSDAAFRDIVASQDVFKRDGKFDPAVYEYTIGRLGYTPKTYRQRVEEEILANQFVGGIFASGFVSPAEVSDFLEINLQERDFHYLTLSLARFIDDIEISDEEVASYYEQQASSFEEPEKITLEYISLSAESLLDQVEVDDEQVRAQFDAEASQAGGETSWQLAHILVEEQPDGSQEALLTDIQERLAAGESFAELAKTYSQDAGSAQQGGELGSFTQADLPEGFEKALASLEPGQVSAPLTTDSGQHLIKLVSKTEGQLPDFDEQKERIRAELALVAAQEMLPRVVEELKEKSYSVDSLSSVAEEMGLEMGISEPFSRTQGSGIAANPKVLETAYSEDVLEKGYASDVMELQDQDYVVIKLKDRIPAHRKPLDEVRSTIVARLKDQKGAEKAQAKAAELLAKVKGGDNVEDIAVADDIPWQVALNATRFEAQADPRVVAAVFAHPPGEELPVSGQVTTASGDVVVYSVSRVGRADASKVSDEERRGLKASLQQLMATREWNAYEEILVGSAKVVK